MTTPAPTTSGYVAGQGAAAGATGAFPTGVDITGLGVSTAEYSKRIPTGAPAPTPPQMGSGFFHAVPIPGPAQPPTSVSFGQALQGLTNLDPAAILQLQQDMFESKLYGKSYYKKGADDPATGLLDAPTLAAYIKTLRLAYNGQKPVTDVLNGLKAAHPELTGITGPDLLQPSYRVTNPADLAQAALSSARSSLGRAPTAQEVATLTQRYQTQEKASQAAAFDANPGSTTPDAGSPGNFADQFFQQNNPQEYAMHNAVGIADQIMQAMQSYGTTSPRSGI